MQIINERPEAIAELDDYKRITNCKGYSIGFNNIIYKDN